jgi:hypothetical protein
MLIGHFVAITTSFNDARKILKYSEHPVCSTTLIQKIANEIGELGIKKEDELLQAGHNIAEKLGNNVKDKKTVFTVELDGGRCKVWQNPNKLADSQWKEVKTGVFCDYEQITDKNNNKINKTRKVESIGRVDESYDVFGLRLYLEAVKRGYNQQTRRVFLCDGAKANWEIWQTYFSESVSILDWYHAVEHLALVSKTIYGENSSLGHEWFEKAKETLYSGNWKHLLKKIHIQIKTMNTAESKRILERERNYFYSNRDRIKYAEFENLGYPIGSGAVESRIKTTVNKRLKGTEKHWRKNHADNILKLRMDEIDNGLQNLCQLYLKAA